MKLQTCSKCGKQVAELFHTAGTPGEFCITCRPTPTPQFDPYVESVNGHVIGEMLNRYEFWDLANANRIAKCFKENEVEAGDWFKEAYPAEYKQGVIMRCYE